MSEQPEAHGPTGSRLLDLVEVMDRLRTHCPWDQRQTHESLVTYLVEETYEVLEAAETGDREHLREELGDLLLQIVFHARIAAEDPDAPWDIDDVAAGIVDKLVRRHPHVFGGAVVADAAEVEANWEQLKAAEKQRSSAVDGVPIGLPALTLAAKLLHRAERAGVTCDRQLMKEDRDPAVEAAEIHLDSEGVGAALFEIVALASRAGVDAEQALRARLRAFADGVRAAERSTADEAASR